MNDYIPPEDGITHINVYSKARTILGLFLSNFAQFPIETEDGNFESVEGYWYWLNVDPEVPGRDNLRKLAFWDAKKIGRELRDKNPEGPVQNGPELIQAEAEFQRKIKAAIRFKIENSSFYDAFVKSSLPFTHYYAYDLKTYKPAGSTWVIEYLEELRKELKNGAVSIVQEG